jgi:hypothetical protein
LLKNHAFFIWKVGLVGTILYLCFHPSKGSISWWFSSYYFMSDRFEVRSRMMLNSFLD